MSTTRRQSRELALQVLFQQEFNPKQSVETGLENFRRSFSATPEVWDYALCLLKGVETNLAVVDAMIQKCAAHWKLNRMALVDLNIMRIATFELKFGSQDAGTTPAVILNEAIEISKKFGTVDSSAFVNGVLDQIVKQ